MVKIETEYNAEFPSHRDIFVQWPDLDLIEIVDSYYFVLDEGMFPKVETFEKALIVLRKLLTDWQSTVKGMGESESAYLPFDFSDEYIGFFKVMMNQRVLLVRYGATRKMFGWSVYPSESTPLPIRSEDEAFLEEEVVSISVEDFVAQIERSIQNLGS